MGRHYLDHASSSPLRPEALAAMTTWLDGLGERAGRRPEPPPPRGDAVPGGPGGGAAAGGHAARGPAARGRVHQWGDRGHRRRGVGRRRARWRDRGAGGGALRGAPVQRSLRRRRRRAASWWWASTPGAGSTPTRSWPRRHRDRASCTSSGATTRWAPSSRWPRSCSGAGPPSVLVHVDAAQAAGRVPIAFDELGADLLSVSGPQVRRAPRHGCAAGAARAAAAAAAGEEAIRSGPGGPAWRTCPP